MIDLKLFVLCVSNVLTANHDVCVLIYVNDMNSCGKKQSENVSNVANQKKHKPKIGKSNKVGPEDRLASSRPSKPRTFLKWLPVGRIFDLSGTITESSNTKVFETPEAELMYLLASCLLSSSRNGLCTL
ncbi:hypothetical protein Tco_0704108 [Tanacetum coccineum]|uniref:Uncharacterized protein n=1 Tax=Tanacetum coccineum TaxID=301880 RepID=A0ABQ4Y1M2_9ASTR